MKASRNHQTLCLICRHPECRQIELEFLAGNSARKISQKYGLGSYRGIYRHMHARGLFERRQAQHSRPSLNRARLRQVLERFIARGAEVKPTPAAIIAAMRLKFQIDQWEAARLGTQAGPMPVRPGEPDVYSAQREREIVFTFGTGSRRDAERPQAPPTKPVDQERRGPGTANDQGQTSGGRPN